MLSVRWKLALQQSVSCGGERLWCCSYVMRAVTPPVLGCVTLSNVDQWAPPNTSHRYVSLHTAAAVAAEAAAAACRHACRRRCLQTYSDAMLRAFVLATSNHRETKCPFCLSTCHLSAVQHTGLSTCSNRKTLREVVFKQTWGRV